MMLSFIDPLPVDIKSAFLVKGKENTPYYTSNSILIGDTLIDTGISLEYLLKLKMDFEINQILFTHWHEDHISGGNYFKDASYSCHLKDRPIIENINNMASMYGYPSEIPEALGDYLSLYDLKNVKIDKTFEDQEQLKLIDDTCLRIIHAPGHSAGHCCFFNEKTGFAFLSDLSMPGAGPWYGALDSSLIDFENSLEKINKLEIQVATLSHYGIIEGKESVKNILNEAILIITERDEKILTHLSENVPKNSEDLWKQGLIYEGSESYEEALILCEKMMIENHFEKLSRDNVIIEQANGYILN